MNKGDEFKSFALKYCIDIARDYTESEVNKFCPKSVVGAWEVGQQFIKYELEEDRKKRKNFVL